MENIKKERANQQIIQFRTDDPLVTITFSQEESVGIKPLILDILTESYRERIQRASPYAKAG